MSVVPNNGEAMEKKRLNLKRPTAGRRYRRLVVIATEGSKTEPQYFGMLNSVSVSVTLKCLHSNNKSSPNAVLQKMARFLKENRLREGDEAWVVIDKDNWSQSKLEILYRWSLGNASQFGLAVSNPSFEYWLLLHFENGNRVTSKTTCLDRLERYLPDYDKSRMNTAKLLPTWLQPLRMQNDGTRLGVKSGRLDSGQRYTGW